MGLRVQRCHAAAARALASVMANVVDPERAVLRKTDDFAPNSSRWAGAPFREDIFRRTPTENRGVPTASTGTVGCEATVQPSYLNLCQPRLNCAARHRVPHPAHRLRCPNRERHRSPMVSPSLGASLVRPGRPVRGERQAWIVATVRAPLRTARWGGSGSSDGRASSLILKGQHRLSRPEVLTGPFGLRAPGCGGPRPDADHLA